MATVMCREEGDVSLWKTILKRETLADFPCVELGECTGENCAWRLICQEMVVYKEYLALRAVVEADRMGLTPEDMASGYRMQALVADGEKRAALQRGAAAWEALT